MIYGVIYPWLALIEKLALFVGVYYVLNHIQAKKVVLVVFLLKLLYVRPITLKLLTFNRFDIFGKMLGVIASPRPKL